MGNSKILLVDDDLDLLEMLEMTVSALGHETVTADNGESALGLLENATFDLVMTDLKMGDVDGIEVLRRAKEIDPEVMVIILTAHAEVKSTIEALRLRA